MTETNPSPALSIPGDFRFGQALVTPDLVPSLGPLAAFAGTFTGSGFNTIFRPNLGSPTGGFPTAPVGPNDNVLELNLTSETLSFSSSLGSVPNRGEVQPDIFLNGVPYVQAITDVTIPAAPVGIHFEPGLWMAVPPTTTPGEGPTLVRMASIPHGTTICAQGTSQTFAGPPTIPPVSITPAGVPPFPSQTASNINTERIPQDLTSFIAAGTINQGILDDPNTVLRHAIAGQNITSTTAISISTDPAGPLFGGGTDNIAFLLGEATAAQPNAQSASMTATFWIETVEHFILVPPVNPGRPLTFPAEIADDGRPVPTFLIDPPIPVTEARRIIVTSTQIQYSQTVILNFNGLAWPHVSVATLVPSAPVTIPPIVWAALLKGGDSAS
ncbi:MAG: heme-binding protein [Trebonia sp.]